MQIVEVKSDLVFFVEDLPRPRRTTTQAQGLILYPIEGKEQEESEQLKEQAEHYDTMYRLVDANTEVRKKGEHGV